MKLLFAIAAGGALGAVARYALASNVSKWLGLGFPYGTLTVNVLGSFLLGLLVELMALKWSVGLEVRAFLVVGVLGAFTTFSTFSLDTMVLYERGELGLAFLYVVTSVVLSVGALFLALLLVRQVAA